MGTKTSRPDTDPEMQRMIDRYVNDALMETGTSGTEQPHGRLARASIPPPIDDFVAPPPVDRAADLVRELAEAMAAAEIAALPDTAYIRALVPSPPAPVRVLFTPSPKEFVDESPTDLDDDEPTGLFQPPQR